MRGFPWGAGRGDGIELPGAIRYTLTQTSLISEVGHLPLDLNQVAAQVEDVIGRLRADFGQQRERVAGALKTLRENEANSEALKSKIESSKTTWLVAGITDGLDRRVLLPTPPRRLRRDRR